MCAYKHKCVCVCVCVHTSMNVCVCVSVFVSVSVSLDARRTAGQMEEANEMRCRPQLLITHMKASQIICFLPEWNCGLMISN